MSRELLKRTRKPALTLALGVVLYMIATSSGAGWLYVITAAIAGVVAVSAVMPWWNVRRVEVSRKARSSPRPANPLTASSRSETPGASPATSWR